MTSSADTQLCVHAGLTEPAGEDPVLAEALDASPFSPDTFQAALYDLLEAMSHLNHELNGPVPSAVVGRGSDVPRSTILAVLEISRLLREHEGRSPAVADAAWSVEVAWRAVLAGDIDDLGEHLRDERLMRG